MVFAAQEKEVQRVRLVPVCGELQQDQQGEEEIGIMKRPKTAFSVWLIIWITQSYANLEHLSRSSCLNKFMQ